MAGREEYKIHLKTKEVRGPNGDDVNCCALDGEPGSRKLLENSDLGDQYGTEGKY
jgi:hypothetical protein